MDGMPPCGEVNREGLDGVAENRRTEMPPRGRRDDSAESAAVTHRSGAVDGASLPDAAMGRSHDSAESRIEPTSDRPASVLHQQSRCRQAQSPAMVPDAGAVGIVLETTA